VKPVHAQLPRGARLYLPDEAARKRHVESRLFDVFRRWGYREIVTPTFEYADVLARGTDVGVQENMFKLVDRETGRMLALRADITPQIARIVATRLRDEPKPLRLGYVTSIFRYDEPRVSHYREFYQAGVELIGLSKPEAEVEVIAMAIEGLRALGLERFQLDLGVQFEQPQGDGPLEAHGHACAFLQVDLDLAVDAERPFEALIPRLGVLGRRLRGEAR